jgi:phosphoglycolate phosphatase
MSCRLAIFDFDGTLADSFPWFIRNVNEVADRHGFRRIAEHEVERLRGLDARAIMAHVGLPLWKAPAVARYMRARMAADIDSIELFPGVDAMLRGLCEAGVKVAIVSSNSAENVRRVLGAEHSGRVSHLGCGAALFGKRSKLRDVLRRSRVAAAQAIAIGDEVRDAQAAQAEGIAFGAVSWGYTRLETLRRHVPREVFTTPEQILARLTAAEG